MKKFSLVVLLLILSIFITSFPQIKEVKSQGSTIYIKADGTIEGTNKIQREGDIYSFSDDLSQGIVVERENAVIDGAGYNLQGNKTEFGIKLESSGVSIKNIRISNFEEGIYVYLTSNNNSITNNELYGNSRGIYVRGTSNNTLTANNLTNNGYGIYLSGTDNVLKNNQMKDNKYNFAITPQSHSNDIGVSNTVNGKPIYYWVNRNFGTLPSDAGCIILIDCSNIIVQDLTLTNNKEGILIVNSRNSEINNCNFSENINGIRIVSSSGITVTQNVFSENSEGIEVWESTAIHIDENNIINNIEGGFYFFDSRKNTISDNYITGGSEGIHLRFNSNNNTIIGNAITNCERAIIFTISSYNILRINLLSNNENHFQIEHDHYSNASKEIPYFINDIDSLNTINGNPMYYWINQQDRTIPTDAGYVLLMNCDNITVSNLQNVSQVLIAFTNNSIISQNWIKNSNQGIKLWRGYNNSIVQNYITNNEIGLSISQSSDNNIYENNISSNNQGISLSGPLGNNIFRNIISNNQNGIYLDWAANNTIYNNNFIDNINHYYDTTQIVFPGVVPSSNYWNQSYPIGGNYWDNYNGTDNDKDGIGDTPYILNLNNQDNHPLMKSVDIEAIPEFLSWTLEVACLSAVFVLTIIYRRNFIQDRKK